MAISLIVGIIFGFGISSAISSFLLLIGLVQKLAVRTLTTHRLTLYKWTLCFGLISGIFIAVAHPIIRIGTVWGTIISTFMGMYVGIVAISLTEVLKVIPILFKKTNLIIGTKSLLFSVAFGKMLGSLLYYFKIK
jgi:stage V sporulation protein AB